jgi:hypothetical protein
VSGIDVSGVAEALDDGGGETTWWYDPSTGQVEMGVSEWMAADFDEDDDPAERGLVTIESFGSRAAYGDMAAFAAAVGDRRAADLLQRALQGRGAFRRFRDTLADFPDLLTHWSMYARACGESRAIEWLVAEGYVDEADGNAEVATRAAALDAVVAAVGHPRGLLVEVATITERWRDIERTLDAGHDVTLLRDGRPWATISPA